MHFSVSSPLPAPVTGEISREDSGDTVKSIFHNILSYNDNVMLAAVISPENGSAAAEAEDKSLPVSTSFSSPPSSSAGGLA
nr:RING-H2 finger protein ATL63-like [Ipomoea batatas]